MNLRFLNLGYFPLSKGKIIQAYKCSHVKRIKLDLETASPKYRGLNLKKTFFTALRIQMSFLYRILVSDINT